MTDLFSAVRYNDIKEVRRLIKEGTDLNVQDEYGYTALIWASLQGYKAITEMLINAGADLNIQDVDGDTALMMAFIRGHKGIEKMLIKAGAK